MTKPSTKPRDLLAAVALIVSSGDVHAGSGLNRWRWGDAGITLSSSSYKYSNMSGLWQAVVNSNGCNIAVDGIYGNITTWYTAIFQNGTHIARRRASSPRRPQRHFRSTNPAAGSTR